MCIRTVNKYNNEITHDLQIKFLLFFNTKNKQLVDERINLNIITYFLVTYPQILKALFSQFIQQEKFLFAIFSNINIYNKTVESHSKILPNRNLKNQLEIILK